MAFRNHCFAVELEYIPGATEGHFTLAGRRYGPFASPDEAERFLVQIVRRWRKRAEELGGWVYRPIATQVVVVLPEDVPVNGGTEIVPWYEAKSRNPGT